LNKTLLVFDYFIFSCGMLIVIRVDWYVNTTIGQFTEVRISCKIKKFSWWIM